MGLKMGEHFGLVARFDVTDACFKSEDILDEVHDLDKTYLQVSRDVFMYEESPSLGFEDNVLPNFLDHFYVSPICSLPSPSPKYFIDTPIENPMIFYSNVDFGHEVKMFNMLGRNVQDYMSLCYLRGYDSSTDPYCVSLEDLPRKITCTTFFNPFYDFSIAINKVKRISILFGVVFIIASYLIFSVLCS